MCYELIRFSCRLLHDFDCADFDYIAVTMLRSLAELAKPATAAWAAMDSSGQRGHRMLALDACPFGAVPWLCEPRAAKS